MGNPAETLDTADPASDPADLEPTSLTSEQVDAIIRGLALRVSATLGAERACTQATFTLVEAATTLGIGQTPLATSLFAIG